MRTAIAYCAGCGHQVHLVFTDPPYDGHANLRDGAEIVCLDYQGECAGGLCPTTGKPGIVMGVRLAKSHLKDETFSTIHAHCDGCGQVSDPMVLDKRLALCALCDTTNSWVTLELSDGTKIILTGK